MDPNNPDPLFEVSLGQWPPIRRYTKKQTDLRDRYPPIPILNTPRPPTQDPVNETQTLSRIPEIKPPIGSTSIQSPTEARGQPATLLVPMFNPSDPADDPLFDVSLRRWPPIIRHNPTRGDLPNSVPPIAPLNMPTAQSSDPLNDMRTLPSVLEIKRPPNHSASDPSPGEVIEQPQTPRVPIVSRLKVEASWNERNLVHSPRGVLPRVGHSANLSNPSDKRVLLFGGHGSRTPENSVHILDIGTY